MDLFALVLGGMLLLAFVYFTYTLYKRMLLASSESTHPRERRAPGSLPRANVKTDYSVI